MPEFTPAPVKPLVPTSALDALDIRVGRILEVHDVPRSDKLVRMIVSFGDHRRTVLCGLKQERADPAALVGRQTLFVVNLEPRKLSGAVSEAMLFDVGYADGVTPALTALEREMPDGARAG